MLLPDVRCGSSLLVSPVLSRLPRVRHGFTTSSLGDAGSYPAGGQAVDRALGAAVGTWTRHGLDQVHGAAVHVAGDETTGPSPPRGDALVTRDRARLLVVRSADCLPVLLAAVGPGGVAGVAAVHAGWRGLVAGVVPAAADALARLTAASRIVAALGPALGPCCFEVGPEVAPALAALGDAACVVPGAGDRFLADMPRIARAQLAAFGAMVPDPQPPPCTRCNADLFPSWRRDGHAAGRLASFIGLDAA